MISSTARGNASFEPSRYSNRALLKEAERCINAGGDSMSQRALGCLSTVTQRYYDHPDNPVNRQDAAAAFRHIGNLYMTYAIDYKAAYKNLLLARQIAEEDANDNELAYIYQSLANLYNVNTTTQNSNRLIPLTNEALSRSVDAAIAVHNEELTATLLLNTLTLQMNHPENPIDSIIEKFNNFKFEGKSGLREYVRLLNDAYLSHRQGETRHAVTLLNEAKRRQFTGLYHERDGYGLDLIAIHMLEEAGLYDMAIEIARSDMEKASAAGHRDYELSMYGLLSNLYEATGQKDSLEKYYNKYLELKQSQEERANLHSVEALRLLSDLESINEQVEQLSVKRQEERRVRIMLYSGLIILLITSGALLYVHLNLKRKHRELFAQHEISTRRDARHELIQRELEKNIETLRNEVERLTPSNKDKSVTPDSDDTADLIPIYTRIVSIAENCADVYSPGYSLQTMASTLGVTARNVSRAINTLHGCNFHQFLNEYRIRRACQMMKDPANDGFTIESISENVGFKSRTSFATLFKKVMGLTPTDYWKLARDSRKS